MTTKFITLGAVVLVLAVFAGCVQPAPQIDKQAATDSIKQAVIDSLTQTFTNHNDSLLVRDSVWKVTAAQSLDSIDRLNIVKLMAIPSQEFYSLNKTEILQLIDSGRTFSAAISGYNVNGNIQGIYPDRDTSTYHISENHLELLNADNFWKYSKYCYIILDDEQK